MDRHSILLVEDDEATRALLTQAIEAQPALDLAFAAASCAEARRCIEASAPDVLLTDLDLPDGNGIELVREVRERDPDALAMVITVFGDDDSVMRAVEAGAAGYLLKGSPGIQVGEAILELLAGGSPMTASIARAVLRLFRERADSEPKAAPDAPELTERELEILRLVAKGFKFGEIAEALDISPHTVKTHVRHIYRKLEVDSRSTAVYEAMHLGLVKPTD